MTEPLNAEVTILNAALELPTTERAAYVEKACAGNAALRTQIEGLVQAEERAKGFLEGPPTGVGFKRTMLVSTVPSEKPGGWIGRYKFLQQIGEGGCGVV